MKLKLRDAGVTVFIVLAVLAAIGIATRHVTKVEDHPVEELVEDIIEDQTGLSIDLSPGSEEK